MTDQHTEFTEFSPSVSHPQPPTLGLPNQLQTDLFTHIQPHLARLGRTSYDLKVATIQQIALRKILGAAFDTDGFWSQRDALGRKLTCSRATYKKWRSHDAAFVSVLEAVLREVSRFRTQRSSSFLEEAIVMMHMAAPQLVQTALDAVAAAAADGEHRTALYGSFGLLDRASSATADKGRGTLQVAQGDDLRALLDEADDELAAWETELHRSDEEE